MSSKRQQDISHSVIEGCAKQDKNCQRIVYETFYRSMYSICLRYSSNEDEAKDLLHEGFIKLFRKVKTFKGESAFGTWVSRLFTNHCIDYVRSAYKKYINYVEHLYSDQTEEMVIEEEAESTLSRSVVFQAMNDLRPDYRLVLNLYAIEKLSHAEIAEKLGIREASSRSKLSRARQALKKNLNIE